MNVGIINIAQSHKLETGRRSKNNLKGKPP